ncbi:MAG: alpha-1,4-glucan--maltose-1-phosphate maltosyltransferase [Bryobacteraceae bacterium]|nr:alpha-1,4-glucan--maltose-1-phosphate maltosyltransferase [Bryobacterales bacterium]NUN01140.1 alpha-1,4-glucan--maltose-1-phosphate maltosyltransferase [Bryobacteraceae bacterium]
MPADDGRKRVVIEGVSPEIDGGRFPVKRTVGESVTVEADIFTDGHDALAAVLLYKNEGDETWTEVPMSFLLNDRWSAQFQVDKVGRYHYTLQAWVDTFQTWRRDMVKRIRAATDADVDYLVGVQLVEDAAGRATLPDRNRLQRWAEALRTSSRAAALDEEMSLLMARYPDRRFQANYPKELPVTVDRERARYSAWYEFFPRSVSPEPGRHGTLRDATAHLSYVRDMGFDIVYFPPIHPIGKTHRKGKNNSVIAEPDDVGSPWAIGADEGGHKSIHPELGTIGDFRKLMAEAKRLGLEVALDIAFQCSPDHPYVKEHPSWFRQRPDGTVQYAENPPKKYQDIYPFDFETPDWRGLWNELKSVFLFWIGEGVRTFRVDNPHTKPYAFWEWVIGEVKNAHPDVIFLSEAFTRPKVMYALAKLGFTQSYTYFAWRNTKWELERYFTELTKTQVREFLRPNLWPNTPDILTEYLQFGGRPAAVIRLVLAATLGASYGIYGPAFELFENRPRESGSEEYFDSEKYQLRHWNLNRPDSLYDFIARVNSIRRDNPALHRDWSLRFHRTDNENIICYSKRTEDSSNTVLVAVNLDPHHTQSGWIELDPEEIPPETHRPYQVHDLLSEARYLWQGQRNYVELNPKIVPAHIFTIRRRIRTERDFDYYM